MMLFPAKSTHNLLVTVKAHIKHIWNTHTSTKTSCEVRHSDKRTSGTHLDTLRHKQKHIRRHSDTKTNTSEDTDTNKNTKTH